MPRKIANKEFDNSDVITAEELLELQRIAKIASIYHKNEYRFKRNPKLSHLMHASLHLLQILILLGIESFHHIHHYTNRKSRETDKSIPPLPEERNPIFFVYPICMILSAIFAVLWLFKKILPRRPKIAFIGCFAVALAMLITGIMEMKHADTYIDLAMISDEELLHHPVYIHNFVMCISSIFVMTLYLIQMWLLFDHWQWAKKHENPNSSSDFSSDRSKASWYSKATGKEIEKKKELPGRLDPIPSLEKLSSMELIITDKDIYEDADILYCFCVDYFVYLKRRWYKQDPVHEFQVVHVI